MDGACFLACAFGAVGATWFLLTVPETFRARANTKSLVSHTPAGAELTDMEQERLVATGTATSDSDAEDVVTETRISGNVPVEDMGRHE